MKFYGHLCMLLLFAEASSSKIPLLRGAETNDLRPMHFSFRKATLSFISPITNLLLKLKIEKSEFLAEDT